jgi:putative NADPH-quinone reductase
MLKGWFERVWVHGVAAEVHDDGRPPSPLLTNIRRVVAITTHGSPKWLNSVQGESGKRFVKRSLRASINRRSRIEWIALYGVDRVDDGERQRFLDRVSRRIARIA